MTGKGIRHALLIWLAAAQSNLKALRSEIDLLRDGRLKVRGIAARPAFDAVFFSTMSIDPACSSRKPVESWRRRPFLVAEYLAGGTLADRLRRGPVPEREAVSITAALAAALAVLHDAGYRHGDVKPSNIPGRGGQRRLVAGRGPL